MSSRADIITSRPAQSVPMRIRAAGALNGTTVGCGRRSQPATWSRTVKRLIPLCAGFFVIALRAGLFFNVLLAGLLLMMRAGIFLFRLQG